MKNLSKLFTLSAVLAVSLFADTDADVINFEKKRIAQNPNVEVKSITVGMKKELSLNGWTGYILDVQAKVQGKDINVKDILFSDGKYVSLELMDLKSGKSLKDEVTPPLSEKYYDEKKLIAGNAKAKDKLVIFSDPLCPFCIDFVPDVIKYVKKHSDSIALYYYHFPLLRLHEAAGPLSKIMEVAKAKGMEDVELKVYETDWEPYFNVKTTDEKKILEGFNKVFKTKITLEEINTKEVATSIMKDIEMGDTVMVQGTPTIFVNGVKDNSKTKYETLGK